MPLSAVFRSPQSPRAWGHPQVSARQQGACAPDPAHDSLTPQSEATSFCPGLVPGVEQASSPNQSCRITVTSTYAVPKGGPIRDRVGGEKPACGPGAPDGPSCPLHQMSPCGCRETCCPGTCREDCSFPGLPTRHSELPRERGQGPACVAWAGLCDRLGREGSTLPQSARPAEARPGRTLS